MSKFIDIKQKGTPVKVDFAKELLCNRKEAMSAMLGSLRDSVEQRITNEHGQWARSNTTRFGRAMDALGVHIQPQGWGGYVTIRKNNLPLLQWLDAGAGWNGGRFTRKKKQYRGTLAAHPFFRTTIEANVERAKAMATSILER
mgnify:FL=1